MILADHFRKERKHPFEIKRVSPTKANAQFLEAVFGSGKSLSELRVLYSPRKEWGSSANLPDYIGAWLVEYQPSGEFIKLGKLHGSIVTLMFAAGVLEVDMDTFRPHRRVTVFKVTPEAIESYRQLYQHVCLSTHKTVTEENVKQIAGRYDFELEFTRNHGKFTLTEKRPGANLGRVKHIYQTTDGKPLIKINDMSAIAWDDYLYAVRKEVEETYQMEI